VAAILTQRSAGGGWPLKLKLLFRVLLAGNAASAGVDLVPKQVEAPAFLRLKSTANQINSAVTKRQTHMPKQEDEDTLDAPGA
jgi:hypothetical protein